MASAAPPAAAPPARGGFGGGFGGGGGEGGRMGGGPGGRDGRDGRGPGGPGGARPARPPRRGNDERAVWVPVTNLGRLVRADVIHSIEEIFLHSLAIKEHQIVDHFFGKQPQPGAPVEEVVPSDKPVLHDEVMGIMSVQKQSASGQCTRFKAFVIVGDKSGHLGFGSKVAKEVATAIRGGIISAKLALVPIRRGYWGNNIGLPHTVPMRVSGKCASVRGRLIPAPRGTGVVGSPIAKKVLGFAGVLDCFCSTTGHTRTSGNFVHAYYRALARTYGFLTPDLWRTTGLIQSPLDEYAKELSKAQERKAQAAQAAVAA